MTSDSGDYTYPDSPLRPMLGPAPAPLRPTFDTRTEPERMVMWCASLERRLEDLALRVAYLEMQAHKQANAAAQRLSADTLAHRLLNPGEEEEP